MRITGLAEFVLDEPIRREIWNAQPLLREWLGEFDNLEFILYRIRPGRVGWMQKCSTVYHDVPFGPK